MMPKLFAPVVWSQGHGLGQGNSPIPTDVAGITWVMASGKETIGHNSEIF